MFEFEYPYVFLTLILFIICAFTCKYKKATFYMHLFGYEKNKIDTSYFTFTLKWLMIVSLIVALASPVSKVAKANSKPAHAVVLLMDTSESMVKTAGGFFRSSKRSDKFDKAKDIAATYISQRDGDHIGIIVFGDFAYVASPLSFDNKSSAQILKNIQQGVAGNKTAMFDALFLSTRLLKDSPAKEKAVILLTDGYNTSGEVPLEAALRAVKSENLKVFTIGIGVEGEFDKKSLQHIAKSSGGEFFHSVNADDLKAIYKKIDELQKTELEDKNDFKIEYLYIYPLLFSIVCMLLYFIIGRKKI